MKLANVRGTKDYLPNKEIIRERIVNTLKEVFQRYGYSPLDTPALENFDLLSAKYAGGSEILKETFKITDLGGRTLGLRYDLTVPFSRVIAMNPQLKMPFKRYQIAKVWRNGPVGASRYREFLQCDVDLVGSKSMKSDTEILEIANEVFKKLKMNPVILVNNRKVLNAILSKFGIENKEDAIMIIDKFEKLSKDEIMEEFNKNGIAKSGANGLYEFFKDERSKNIKFVESFIETEEGKQGIAELNELFTYLKYYHANVVFDPPLARGLSFYTGTVFETFLQDNKVKSAVASGGRYDKIIGQLLQSKQEIPAVGISFGLDRIYDALIDANQETNSTTKVFVLPIQIYKEAIQVTQKIRNAGINAEVDIVGRGISKNLNYVNSLKIPYVVFIGKKELAEKKFKLRDMKTGKEKFLNINQIIKFLK